MRTAAWWDTTGFGVRDIANSDIRLFFGNNNTTYMTMWVYGFGTWMLVLYRKTVIAEIEIGTRIFPFPSHVPFQMVLDGNHLC